MKVPLRGADLCPPAGGRERLGAAPLLKKDRAVFALSSSVGGLASSCRQSVRRSQPRARVLLAFVRAGVCGDYFGALF